MYTKMCYIFLREIRMYFSFCVKYILSQKYAFKTVLFGWMFVLGNTGINFKYKMNLTINQKNIMFFLFISENHL